MAISTLLVLLSATACALGGWFYFQRVQMPRPPVGVFTLSDVLIVFAFIILIPMLYMGLPSVLLMGILLFGGLSLVYFVVEPLIRRPLAWLLTIAIIGADLASGSMLGIGHPVYQAVNTLFVVLAVIGISNTWAQAGMKARDAAILGTLLIAYDFIATTQLSLMGDVFARLSALPLSPLITWGQGNQAAAIGLGDLLMLTVFPLTMMKGFGKQAGLTALIVGISTLIGIMLLPTHAIFPVMVVLGPMIAVQYLMWRQRSSERPMKAYTATAN